jgi:hypothetical protein
MIIAKTEHCFILDVFLLYYKLIAVTLPLLAKGKLEAEYPALKRVRLLERSPAVDRHHLFFLRLRRCLRS